MSYIQKLSNQTPSLKETGLTKSLILREQDERAVIKDLAMRLLNVAKLFTLDYSEESAVLLAQWVYKKYAVESLETVQKVLSNPPNTGEKVWRLTPDIITIDP